MMLQNPTIHAATAPLVVSDLRLYPRSAIKDAMMQAIKAWLRNSMAWRVKGCTNDVYDSVYHSGTILASCVCVSCSDN